MAELWGNFHTCTTIVVQDIMHFIFKNQTLSLLRLRVPPLFFVKRKVFFYAYIQSVRCPVKQKWHIFEAPAVLPCDILIFYGRFFWQLRQSVDSDVTRDSCRRNVGICWRCWRHMLLYMAWRWGGDGVSRIEVAPSAAASPGINDN
jgi:hypothetical protein